MTRSHTPARPCFESLEPRVMLDGSVLVSVVEGELRVTGDAEDNAIVLQGTDNGGYRVTGLPTDGVPTLINGGAFAEVPGGFPLRIQVDLGGGDDTLNIGTLDGTPTTLSNIVDYSGGHGVNTLNIGRIDNDGTLQFAGQVTIDAMVEFDNRTFGTGHILITGAELSALHAHLGYGDGERSVVIADLWYGMTYSPPSDIYDIDSVMRTNLDIDNPYGALDALIQDTTGALVTIHAADRNDSITLKGVRFNDTDIRTYSGEDVVWIGASEFRTTRIEGLAVRTGRHHDSVWISDAYIGGYTDFLLGRDGGFGMLQTLRISAYGPTELHDLRVRGRGVDVSFNGIAGVNETLVHGSLDIQTQSGLVTDIVTFRNVRARSDTTVALRGGDDRIGVYDSRFSGVTTFNLSQGDDRLTVGAIGSVVDAGDPTWFGSLIAEMRGGSDQVVFTHATVNDLLFVNMGASAGRGQRARIAHIGTVSAGDLGVAGTGRTNVFIGNAATEGPSVEIDGIFSISTGMDTSRDNIAIQNVDAGGGLAISSGAGTDLVGIQRSTFGGPVMIQLGNGVDILSIWDCHFEADAEFFGDRMLDWMWVLDSEFDGRAVFDGGHGRDRINRNLNTRNTFNLIGQPLVDIERTF